MVALAKSSAVGPFSVAVYDHATQSIWVGPKTYGSRKAAILAALVQATLLQQWYGPAACYRLRVYDRDGAVTWAADR